MFSRVHSPLPFAATADACPKLSAGTTSSFRARFSHASFQNIKHPVSHPPCPAPSQRTFARCTESLTRRMLQPARYWQVLSARLETRNFCPQYRSISGINGMFSRRPCWSRVARISSRCLTSTHSPALRFKVNWRRALGSSIAFSLLRPIEVPAIGKISANFDFCAKARAARLRFAVAAPVYDLNCIVFLQVRFARLAPNFLNLSGSHPYETFMIKPSLRSGREGPLQCPWSQHRQNYFRNRKVASRDAQDVW